MGVYLTVEHLKGSGSRVLTSALREVAVRRRLGVNLTVEHLKGTGSGVLMSALRAVAVRSVRIRFRFMSRIFIEVHIERRSII